VEKRHLYTDQASGARQDRPGFLACWAYLSPGDTLVVWRLDRRRSALRRQARGYGLALVLLLGRRERWGGPGALTTGTLACMAYFWHTPLRKEGRSIYQHL
jgi:hypothetical protein